MSEVRSLPRAPDIGAPSCRRTCRLRGHPGQNRTPCRRRPDFGPHTLRGGLRRRPDRPVSCGPRRRPSWGSSERAAEPCRTTTVRLPIRAPGKGVRIRRRGRGRSPSRKRWRRSKGRIRCKGRCMPIRFSPMTATFRMLPIARIQARVSGRIPIAALMLRFPRRSEPRFRTQTILGGVRERTFLGRGLGIRALQVQRTRRAWRCGVHAAS